MSTPSPVTDRDLMAYADGLLNGYPQRKLDTEAYLARSTEASAYVAKIRRQNEALRTSSDALLAELDVDIPSLADISAPPPRRRTMRHGGALAAMILAAVGLGWVLGENSTLRPAVSEAFLGEVADLDARLSSNAPPRRDVLGTSADRIEAPLPVSTDQPDAAIQLIPPDLDDLGFHYEGMRLLRSGNVDVVQLSYRVLGTSDQTMRLYIGPADIPATKERASIESRARTLHYWRSGPFSVVTTFSGKTPLSNRLLDRLATEQPLLQIAPQRDRPLPSAPPALNAQSLPGNAVPGGTLQQHPDGATPSAGSAARFN